MSRAEQRTLTERVHRAERRRKLDAWTAARKMMLDGAEAAQAALGTTYRSDLRGVGRAVARIDERLRA